MIKKGLRSTILCVILLFLIIYPLKFVFFPYLSTRVLLGFLGLALFFKKNTQRILNGKSNNIYGVLIAITLMSLIALLINGTSDTTFVTFPLTVILILSACNFTLSLIKKTTGSVTVEKVIYYFVWAVNIQMFFTILFLAVPTLKDVMQGLLTEELRALPEERTTILSFRVTGFGAEYFGAGVINSIAVLLSVYQIIRNDFKNCRFYYLSLIIIFIVGNALSRTTLVGYIIAIAYLISTNPKGFVRFFVKASPILAVLIVFAIPKINLSEDMEQQARFAFEIFYNYFEEGSLETGSGNDLLNSYSIQPTSLKTWIIGDGRFVGNTGETTYMETDSGFMRLIFYFGLIGLFLMVLFHYRMGKIMSNIIGDKTLSVLFFIMFLAANFKGWNLFAIYYGLFMFLPVNNVKTR